MAQWSQQIESAYQLTLPDDVRSWIDDELWRRDLGAEFSAPLEPDQLLTPGREEIWAGFMPPDTLPLIGNDYGDWLCLRVGRDSRVAEVIKWSHSGGDWQPMGRSLSEALVFDAALRLLRRRRPEFTSPEPPRPQVYGAAEWAVQRGAVRIEPFWNDGELESDQDRQRLLQRLIDADIAATPARQELALLQLDCPLKQRSVPQTVRQAGVRWNPDFVRWLFDPREMDGDARRQLAAEWQLDEQRLVAQDWEGAEGVAMEVASARADLGWAFDVAGWAAERRGDWATAAAAYRRGVQASVFADDSIRFRTQWFPEGFGKFPAFRLHELAPRLGAEEQAALDEDEYLQLFWRDEAETLRDRVTEYWRRRAASREGSWEAYECLCGAGWDLGMSQLPDYSRLLEQLSAAARDCGAAALARIAKTHLRVF